MEATTAERYASGGRGGELHAQNLALAFAQTVERLGDEPAIISGEGDDTLEVTWNELAARVRRIAGGLAALGVGKGDTVALMLNNRPEFIPIDMAAVSLGAVPFSIYQTSSPEQIEYVCSRRRRQGGDHRVGVPRHVQRGSREAAGDRDPGRHRRQTAASRRSTQLEALDPDFDPAESIAEVQPDDLLTLIYTSGTTGPPKGVQLTHRNLMSLVGGVDEMIEFPERGGKVISWLPAAHIAERGANYYLPVVQGLTVTVCPDPREIVEFLPRVRPTWFFAVPRIWEKLKAGLEAKLAGGPRRGGRQDRAALEAALQKVRLEQAGEEVPEQLAAAVAKADEAMFSKLREALGLDEAVAVNVGAAPTPLEVLEFFHAIGIPIGELWGMSETCGVGDLQPARAGQARHRRAAGARDRDQARRGRRGAGQGAVERCSATATCRRRPPRRSTDEGWLATGDIGELDEDGYLKIVDRKKELIINAAGKNMSPANIESHLKAASPLIGQAVAIGDRRPYNVALIVLDPDFAPVWAKQNGLEGKSTAELASEPDAGRGGPGRGRRREREDGSGRADQEVQAAAGGLGAGRRRADADDEAEAQADRREVRGRDRGAVRGLAQGVRSRKSARLVRGASRRP